MAMGRVPEHPDVIRERRRHILTLVVGLATIGIFAGVVLLAVAFSASSWWAGVPTPPEIQQGITNEYRTGAVLIAASIAAILICMVGAPSRRR
jgi:hypothetical protein